MPKLSKSESLDLFAYRSYREYLADLVDAKKRVGARLSYAALADAARVQRSYFSHVMSGRASFSADQLYAVAVALGLAADERDFLLLLLEWERAGVPERKRELAGRLDAIRNARLKSERALKTEAVAAPPAELAAYYASPLPPKVHMLMTIPSYRKDPARIAARLGIGEAQLEDTLATLVAAGVLVLSKKGYELGKRSMHLNASHFLSRVHGTMARLDAIRHAQTASDDTDHFFTATFAASEQTKASIKADFLEFLEKASRRIREAPGEEVYQINFDLFRA